MQLFTTRGNYVHINTYGKIGGGGGGMNPEKDKFFKFSQNIDGFRQNDLQDF